MDKASINILVAEDEIMLREMTSLILDDEGYRVDTAEDGEIAWQLLLQNQYDLLITDLYMPKMGGIELISQCKHSLPQLKTLLISGGGKDLEVLPGNKQIRFKGEPIEISSFLKKPYDVDDLLNLINELLTTQPEV